MARSDTAEAAAGSGTSDADAPDAEAQADETAAQVAAKDAPAALLALLAALAKGGQTIANPSAANPSAANPSAAGGYGAVAPADGDAAGGGAPDARSPAAGSSSAGPISAGPLVASPLGAGAINTARGSRTGGQGAAGTAAFPGLLPGRAPESAARTPSPGSTDAPIPASPDAAAVAAPADGTASKATAAEGVAPEGTARANAAVGKDFLAALADAGQAVGQAAGAFPVTAFTGQGGPDASAGATAAPAAIPGATAATAPTATVPQGAQAAPTVQAAPPVPIGQVPMTIGLRSLAGSSEFQIRLDPAELGRIEVKLEIDKARGTVTTHLVVDRPETLALLRRDAGQLQQALSQTGLDASGGGLNLSLRGDGAGQGDAFPRGGRDGSPQGGTPWRAAADAAPEATPVRRLRGYGGLDIRI